MTQAWLRRCALLTVLVVGALAGCSFLPAPAPPTDFGGLEDRSFRLVSLFTDAGGEDTRYPDASFVITFHRGSATAVTHCGQIEYPQVSEATGGMGTFGVNLGTPQGPPCSLGSDPSGPPQGTLGWGYDKNRGEYWLSTGFVWWRFVEETK